MTAEVAILNAEGVVLAADSAVTLQTIDGQKAIPRASKIYALSDEWPVAAMFYGSARFMGVPWETLIKEYRQTRGHRPQPHVQDYTQDFLTWLAGSARRFPSEELDRALRSHTFALVHGFLQAVKGEVGVASPTQRSVRAAAAKVLKKAAPAVAQDVIEPFPIPARALELIHRYVEDALERTPLTADQRRDLKAQVVDRVAGADMFRSARGAGIVIAGFGTEQWLPAVDHRRVGLLLSEGALQAAKVQQEEIDGNHLSVIMPVANATEIRAFLEGIHPDFARALIRHKGVAAGGAQGRERALKEIVSQTAREEFTTKIAQMASLMPREELAVMAETLVNLCAFRQRLSGQIETVSGPVDVAVISKGDGLVWVKRKHYFPPELNEPYFQRRAAQRRSP